MIFDDKNLTSCFLEYIGLQSMKQKQIQLKYMYSNLSKTAEVLKWFEKFSKAIIYAETFACGNQINKQRS